MLKKAVNKVRAELNRIENKLLRQAETVQGLDDRINGLMRRRGIKDDEDKE